MIYIADKVILLLISFVISGFVRSAVESVVALLIVVLFICINSYMEKKNVIIITSILYLVVAIFNPTLCLFLPVVWYELLSGKCEKIGIIELFVGLVIMRVYEFEPLRFWSIGLMAVVATYLYYGSYRKKKLEIKVRKIRDDSEEKNLLLEANNRNLIEKQNSEIYVATLKERNRIAREIHDNVGHVITRTILQLGALMTIHKEEPLHGQLELVKNNLDIAMNSIRESVHDLHDESIDLEKAIDDIVDSLRDRFSVSYDYDINSSVKKEHKYTIIGIVKEAVSNIIKHSNNENVSITLREHPAMLQIVIHDYARNVSGKAESNDSGGDKTGIGLRNISDRVEKLKGQFRIETDNGFKIFISIPKENL